ncbi:MAG: hypothetical protein OCU24_02970 [Candidatus Methanospirare jalkutatii]|nr:hypothetical protein [Candidatus Methanospirare jalkutatii]
MVVVVTVVSMLLPFGRVYKNFSVPATHLECPLPVASAARRNELRGGRLTLPTAEAERFSVCWAYLRKAEIRQAVENPENFGINVRAVEEYGTSSRFGATLKKEAQAIVQVSCGKHIGMLSEPLNIAKRRKNRVLANPALLRVNHPS